MSLEPPDCSDHPDCLHCDPDPVSPLDPDVRRTLNCYIGNEDIRHSAARLSQSDDEFVSLFPIVANVLIITRSIMIIISQSEAVILTNQRPGRGQYHTSHLFMPSCRHMIICGYEPSLSLSLVSVIKSSVPIFATTHLIPPRSRKLSDLRVGTLRQVFN